MVVIDSKWESPYIVSDELIMGCHKQTLEIDIELEKDIPSIIYFEGEKLKENYHRADVCPKRRPTITKTNYETNYPWIGYKQKGTNQVNDRSAWTKPKITVKNTPPQSSTRLVGVKNNFRDLYDSLYVKHSDPDENENLNESGASIIPRRKKTH